MLKEELEILDIFRKNLFLEDSIRGLMKKTGNKSYGRIFEASQSLIKQSVLLSRKIGSSTVCSLNLNSEKTISHLSFLEAQNSLANIKNDLEKNIKSLISIIPLKYFSFIIAENYAESKSSKKSEINLIVIVDNEIDSAKILNILESKTRLMSPKINAHVFKVSEFSSMLLSKDENYIKEVYKNRIIFYGSQNYYIIIREAIEHGFKA